MTSLSQALEDYLQIRRQLGFKLKTDEPLLENFVAFLERAGAQRITVELAVMWARLPADAHPHRWRQRLGIVRGFARYLSTIDPASEVPSVDLLAGYRPRVAPYIYSPAEIGALMAAARALTPALRAATFETVIGLMASTGLRLGEALGLDRGDVDLEDGGRHTFCVSAVVKGSKFSLSVNCDTQIAVSGMRSPKWIRNAASAELQL